MLVRHSYDTGGMPRIMGVEHAAARRPSSTSLVPARRSAPVHRRQTPWGDWSPKLRRQLCQAHIPPAWKLLPHRLSRWWVILRHEGELRHPPPFKRIRYGKGIVFVQKTVVLPAYDELY
jgi:hypothetical protein